MFLVNAYTGEAIYDVDKWGAPLPGVRKFSHWFEPVAQVPTPTVRSSSRRSGDSKVSTRYIHAPDDKLVHFYPCRGERQGTYPIRGVHGTVFEGNGPELIDDSSCCGKTLARFIHGRCSRSDRFIQ